MKRLLLLLLLCGCTPVENAPNPEVFFCPQDNCTAVFARIIESSDAVVYCAFYELAHPAVIKALNSSDSKVIIDRDNYFSLNGKTRSAEPLMHNKFCVTKDTVVTGSLNPIHRGDKLNNNNVIIIHSRYISDNYKAEFMELWKNSRPKKVKYPQIILNNKTVENYFCPEDCENRILPLIEKAENSIYFMTFSFTRDDLGDALIDAHKRDVKVKGVCEKTQNNKWHEFDKLKNAGLDVKWDNNPANMHHKVFIIDNKTVVTGSMNPSKNGLERNDENVLILHDEKIAKEFLEEFERS
ncbi:MAG: phospholipase D-like domain-containing protein [Nanoarchaeota archaeon]